MNTYKIVRMYCTGPSHTVRNCGGLSLEEAQLHCRDPESSSKTATTYVARRRTEQHGPWFDGYEQE